MIHFIFTMFIQRPEYQKKAPIATEAVSDQQRPVSNVLSWPTQFPQAYLKCTILTQFQPAWPIHHSNPSKGMIRSSS